MTTPELDHVLDAAPIGVAVQDANGKFLRANRAFLDMLGMSFAELSDRTWHEVTHPADVKSQARVMGHVFTAGEPEDFVKRYVTKTGRVIWARLTFDRTDSDKIVVFAVPMPEAEPPEAHWIGNLGKAIMENWKTGFMLVATAFGSIWAQYQSFVGRIENAERRATQAERDVELLRPLLLKLQVQVKADHAPEELVPESPPKAQP